MSQSTYETAAEICRANSWGPGSILEDFAGHRVVLTAVGDFQILFRRVEGRELAEREGMPYNFTRDAWKYVGRWRKPRGRKGGDG